MEEWQDATIAALRACFAFRRAGACEHMRTCVCFPLHGRAGGGEWAICEALEERDLDHPGNYISEVKYVVPISLSSPLFFPSKSAHFIIQAIQQCIHKCTRASMLVMTSIYSFMDACLPCMH